jgi:hypothetical protein
MPKIIILLLIGFSSFAQITISGASQFDNPYPLETYIILGTASPTDPDTHVYGNNYFIFALGQWVRRANNHWQIGSGWSGSSAIPIPGSTIGYETLNSFNTIDPPCTALWNIMSNGIPVGNPVTLTITGNACNNTTSIFSQSTVINPNNIQLAVLTNAQILEIPNPKLSMIVFDLDNFRIMLYNGISWNCL